MNYPAQDWSALTALLVREPSALGPMDRANLLNDAFSLAESGHIGYTVPLDMTRYMEQEEHLVPWDTVYDKLVAMGSLLELSPTFPLFKKYVVDLVSKQYQRLGWLDNGTHTERMNRSNQHSITTTISCLLSEHLHKKISFRGNIIGLTCKYGHTQCSSEAGKLFKKWVSEPGHYIAPNLRSLVYTYGMIATGTPEAWQVMLERYLAEINVQVNTSHKIKS